jgi:hypothetical protein
MVNKKQNLVKQVGKMIRKAVVRMRSACKKFAFGAYVLTGGFLAWTGRDAMAG